MELYIIMVKWLKKFRIKKLKARGGGQVVSMSAFYSFDPSSNPAEACIFIMEK